MLKIGLTGNIACGKSFISRLFGVYGVIIIDSDMIAREVVKPGSPALEQIAQRMGSHLIMDDGNLNRAAMRELVFADKEKLAILCSITHPAIHDRTLELCDRCARGEGLPEDYLSFVAQEEQRRQAAAQAAQAARAAREAADAAATAAGAGAYENGEIRDSDGLLISDSHCDEGKVALSEPLDASLVLDNREVPPYIILDIPLLFENHLEDMVDRILVVDSAVSTQIARIISRDGCSEQTARNIIDRQLSRTYKREHADDIIETDVLSIAEKRHHVLNLHIRYLKLSQSMS